MGLEYAPTVISACCILHNFLIEEGDIGGDDQDKELNSKAPLKFEYISEDERRLENIAKKQRETIFNKWVKEKYKMERKKLREKK